MLCANPGYRLVCKLFLIGQSDGSSVKEVSLGKLLLALYELRARVCTSARVFCSARDIFNPASCTDDGYDQRSSAALVEATGSLGQAFSDFFFFPGLNICNNVLLFSSSTAVLQAVCKNGGRQTFCVQRSRLRAGKSAFLSPPILGFVCACARKSIQSLSLGSF